MTDVFVKRRAGAGPSYYRAEAAGLAWLREAAGAPVPEVIGVERDSLTIARVPPQHPTADAAHRLGEQLARTHGAGAASFGAAPPGSPEPGWIADVPMAFGRFPTFAPMYVELRIEPYLRAARESGRLGRADADAIERLQSAVLNEPLRFVGPPEPPARLHGDLWHGNVVWSAGDDGAATGWLIDPAAYGGHRETDLAMLALFGVPHFERIVQGYETVSPLAPGWRQRVDLHQVYPLLVHAVLFGGGYGEDAAAAARRSLARREPG